MRKPCAAVLAYVLFNFDLHIKSINAFIPQNSKNNKYFETTKYHQPQFEQRKIRTSLAAYTLEDSKWESLGIDEDLEPKWYILNCMATAEFTVLKNLQDNCTGATTDIIKFSVPTETKGTSRMKKTFTEEKPLFQGYVFVQCKLTAAAYDSIAQVKSVRGWMGIPRQVGRRSMLPIPCPLEGSELKKFHLLEETQIKKEDAIATGVYDPEDPGDAFDITFGFEVGQYVKILDGPHTGEDGIVRKFRDGKIGVRMFTYGSQFDGMFEAKQLYKMNELEVARGLIGPERSINQEEFNEKMGLPPPRRRGEGGPRRSLGRGESNTRNRRQDRIARGERGREGRNTFDAAKYKEKSEAELWDTFQDMESSSRGRRDRNIFDDNSGKRMGKTTTDSAAGEDDFFNDLMNELADDLGEKKASKQERRSDKFDDDDDFFAALEQEMKSSNQSKPSKKNSSSSNAAMDEDDFFAALEQEMSSSSPKTNSIEDNEDDFFAALEQEMKASSETPVSKSLEEDDFFATLEQEMNNGDTPKKQINDNAAFEDDDFFSALEQEMKGESVSKRTKSESKEFDDDDFFASLDLSDAAIEKEEPTANGKVSNTKKSSSESSNNNNGDLSKMTVVQLKGILRERGLPVSGKKADLISRLQS